MRRRRQCSSCGHRFTTYERHDHRALYVRKRDGGRQPFDRAKLRGGLARATHKRPVPDTEIDALVNRIEAEAAKAGGELEAARIGEMCLSGLRQMDEVAYLQFAAVYRQLGVDEVRAELADLAAVSPDAESALMGSNESSEVLGVSGGSVRRPGDPDLTTQIHPVRGE